MYSMKRRTTPASRAQAAIGTTLDSLIPRRTTMFTLTGASPASAAAAIPSRTLATGKSIPFIAPKTASSSESRLTVTRRSPASASGSRERPQRGSVRRERQVDLAAIGPADRRQHGHQVRQVPPHERFATGNPQLLDAQRDEDPRQPGDLLEGQDLVPGQELEVTPIDLLGHAVGAPEIAAVGDRDAQVAQRPPERVGQPGTPIEPVLGRKRRRLQRLHVAMVARARSNSIVDDLGDPPVPPARTAGTSSQLHRTHRR